MTSNLLTLLKVNIRETLDKRKFKNNKKQQTFLVYIILMALLFLGLSTFYSVIYAMNFKTAGMVDYIYTLSFSSKCKTCKVWNSKCRIFLI